MPKSSATQFTYLRGVAPHLDLSNLHSPSSDKDPNKEERKYHPFLGLRVRGLLHPISTPVAATISGNGFADRDLDAGIPGFHLVIMVLFQPTIHYLLSIWEHACEEFGDVFQQTISSQMAQDIENGVDGLTAAGGGLDAGAYEERCREKLRRDLSKAERQRGPLKMGREWVEIVEDKYSEAKDLSWVSEPKFPAVCSPSSCHRWIPSPSRYLHPNIATRC